MRDSSNSTTTELVTSDVEAFRSELLNDGNRTASSTKATIVSIDTTTVQQTTEYSTDASKIDFLPSTTEVPSTPDATQPGTHVFHGRDTNEADSTQGNIEPSSTTISGTANPNESTDMASSIEITSTTSAATASVPATSSIADPPQPTTTTTTSGTENQKKPTTSSSTNLSTVASTTSGATTSSVAGLNTTTQGAPAGDIILRLIAKKNVTTVSLQFTATSTTLSDTVQPSTPTMGAPKTIASSGENHIPADSLFSTRPFWLHANSTNSATVLTTLATTVSPTTPDTNATVSSSSLRLSDNETEDATVLLQTCPGSDKSIPVEQFCDGQVQCPGATDETNCTCINKIDDRKKCDGVFDCPDLEDETTCKGS